jgi:molybdopterin-guanine dinucleotide biosynthesis protein A
MTAPAQDVAAAIIAGGQARRFGGREKAFLEIDGVRIIDRQLAALRPVTPDLVVVVADRPERYAGLGVPVVVDLIAGAGALGGIYTAVASSRADRTIVVACDLPFLTAEFLAHLARAGRGADVVIPRTAAGYEPLCACYARAAADPIRRRIEAGALKAADVPPGLQVREIGPEEIARFDHDGRLLLNVNTPDDYARAQTRTAAGT